MDYALLKLVHQSAVALSALGFVARGLASLAEADWLRGRLARTLPHVVDSVLLASALGLAWTLRINPASAPWLLAKLIALPVYIGLGAVALRAGRPLVVRGAAGFAALFVLAWIVSVALTKSALGFLSMA
jgi:uncharacterized membrane protein SirB2